MRLLYVFPHPDDESFGPAPAMARQRRRGHEVHLLTLTRGGATKRRHELGLSVAEMGAVRRREMDCVAEVLDLSSMTVLDLPDGGLKELDPRRIEAVIGEEVDRLCPEVLISYAAHGISGFEDHLVAHAVVKRLFCERRSEGDTTLRRLALLTLASAPEDHLFPLRASKPEEIDVVIPLTAEELDLQRRALACYSTYEEVIARADPIAVQGDRVAFELFGESFSPPLADLTERLP